MINLSVQQVLSLWAHGTVLRNLTGNGAVAGRGQAGREGGGWAASGARVGAAGRAAGRGGAGVGMGVRCGGRGKPLRDWRAIPRPRYTMEGVGVGPVCRAGGGLPACHP